MANTTVIGGGVIDVTLDASAVWSLLTDVVPKHPEFHDGIRILKIRAKGSATDDLLVIRHNGASGARITNEKFFSAYDTRDISFGPGGIRCIPTVAIAEGSTGVQFTIQYL